jgi:heme oxygenase
LHIDVEQTAFMQALLRGGLDRAGYCLFLRNLREIYAALEAALLRQLPGSAVSLVFSPALVRLTAIERDLDVLHGDDWRYALSVSPVTDRYVARIAELLVHKPDLLVAHAYVRYLGDLSGGQALARLVTRHLDLSQGSGVAFYDFGSPGVIACLKQVFKDGLDRISGSDVELAAIVEEAQLAFRLHAELFAKLAGTCLET